MENTNILEEVKSKLILIAKKYNLDLLILFGSRAKNTEHPNSDYDFAIYSKNNIDTSKYFKIFEEIGILFNEKVDLINIDETITPLLNKEIFNKGICIYEKSKKFFNFKKENSYFIYIDSLALLEPTKIKFLES